jgi:hypothetical protein
MCKFKGQRKGLALFKKPVKPLRADDEVVSN